MDFTALVCCVLCLCSSCLRNCSRRFLNIWFTMRDHCTNPSGLPISHSRPFGSMVSHSRPHSVWQSCSSCLKNCSRRFLNIWFTMRDHCTNPSGLPISHSRPYGSMVSHSRPHSVWQSCSSCLKNCSRRFLNIWFTMRGHCTNPVWFTDLSFKTLWFPDLLFKTSFSLTGGYRMKQLAATLWWSCTLLWRCCCAAFMLYGLLFNFFGWRQLYIVCGGCNVSWMYCLRLKITWSCCR
jgi:hypothetical protein